MNSSHESDIEFAKEMKETNEEEPSGSYTQYKEEDYDIELPNRGRVVID